MTIPCPSCSSKARVIKAQAVSGQKVAVYSQAPGPIVLRWAACSQCRLRFKTVEAAYSQPVAHSPALQAVSGQAPEPRAETLEEYEARMADDYADFMASADQP